VGAHVSDIVDSRLGIDARQRKWLGSGVGDAFERRDKRDRETRKAQQ
jgi:hypothetical protein